MAFAKQTRTRILIAAPVSEVWAALADLRAYPRWNPVLSLRPWRGAQLGAGRRAWLSLKLRRVPLFVPVRVEVVDPGRELAWVGGPRGVLRGRHFFTLREVEAGTELTHGEDFDGLLLPLMWPAMAGQLERLYTSLNEGLAKYVESKQGH